MRRDARNFLLIKKIVSFFHIRSLTKIATQHQSLPPSIKCQKITNSLHASEVLFQSGMDPLAQVTSGTAHTA